MSNTYFSKLVTKVAPAAPGSIQHVVTTGWTQHSNDDDLSGNYYGPPAPDGWQILPHTVKFVIEWSQGTEGSEWSQNIICYNPVGFHVVTIHHRFGTSGKVNFHFEYDLQRI